MTWAGLLDPRFPAGFPCLGERRLNNSACLHLQRLPSPLPHQLLHSLPLNLTVALPRFSPRECSNFAGHKFLPCVVALQLSEYLCTRMVGFPGDFFFLWCKKTFYGRVLNYKYQISLETTSIRAISTNSPAVCHTSPRARHSPRPNEQHLLPGRSAGISSSWQRCLTGKIKPYFLHTDFIAQDWHWRGLPVSSGVWSVFTL